MSPTQTFGRLSLLFLVGALVFACTTKSLLPVLGVLLALWTLLKLTNGLERRR